MPFDGQPTWKSDGRPTQELAGDQPKNWRVTTQELAGDQPKKWHHFREDLEWALTIYTIGALAVATETGGKQGTIPDLLVPSWVAAGACVGASGTCWTAHLSSDSMPGVCGGGG